MAQPVTRARRREESPISIWPFCPASARDDAFGSCTAGHDAMTVIGPMASMSLMVTTMSYFYGSRVLTSIRVCVLRFPGRKINDQLRKLTRVSRSSWACSHALFYPGTSRIVPRCYGQTSSVCVGLRGHYRHLCGARAGAVCYALDERAAAGLHQSPALIVAFLVVCAGAQSGLRRRGISSGLCEN